MRFFCIKRTPEVGSQIRLDDPSFWALALHSLLSVGIMTRRMAEPEVQ